MSFGDVYEPEDQPREKKKERTKTPVLNSFGRDLTKLAKEGKLDPIVGRENEIERITQILGRRKKNNPVLIGEAGTGKTAIVEGLAIRIVQGNVPLSLQDKQIYMLDMTSMVAGTKYRGQFEERMKAVVDELLQNPHIIIFLDEIHTMVGAGNSSGSLDAANILKPALARGEIQCIGATTFDEYRKSIESDSALERRFQKVIVEAPSVAETIEIIKNIKNKYEDHHFVTYSDEIIQKSVILSERFITDRQLPDKAIDIIDEVGSRVYLKKNNLPQEIIEMEAELKIVENKKVESVHKQQYEKAAQFRDSLKNLKDEIENKKIQWKEETRKNKTAILEKDVFEVISHMTGIPVIDMGEDEAKRLLGLTEFLKSKVIGQDEAVEKIATTIQRNKVGLGKNNRPIGNFIFTGTTGVGKTELAKAIARYMFHGDDSLIRVDMSEYMEKHTISKLIGAPPGYVGYDEAGVLTEKVRKKPYAVILFDEIEKAHPDIFNVLLQVLDEGFLTDNHNRKINFRNTLIIMTSNLGARKASEKKNLGFGASTVVDDTTKREIMDSAVEKFFSPEFINRLDEVIYFNTLTKEDMRKILDIHLEDLKERVFEIGYKIQVTDKAKDLIVERGTDPKFGARILGRTLQKMVEDKLSEVILKENPEKGKTLKVDEKNGETVVSYRK
jgi:ATP-dependent Clp protease ATP-binding subunit ClpC